MLKFWGFMKTKGNLISSRKMVLLEGIWKDLSGSCVKSGLEGWGRPAGPPTVVAQGRLERPDQRQRPCEWRGAEETKDIGRGE